MAVSISNEKDITTEELMDESKVMWDKVRANIRKNHRDGASTGTVDVDTMYKSLWKEHDKFCQAYPIVVGEMVQGRFHPKAFSRYLKYLATTAWGKDKDTWLHAQAHYMSILYKQIVPRWNKKDAAAAEESSYQHLKNEDDKWNDSIEEMKEEMRAEEKQLVDLKRSELKAYLARLKGDVPVDGGAGDPTNKLADSTNDPIDDPTDKLADSTNDTTDKSE